MARVRPRVYQWATLGSATLCRYTMQRERIDTRNWKIIVAIILNFTAINGHQYAIFHAIYKYIGGNLAFFRII